MKFRDRIANFLFRDVIVQAQNDALKLASVSVTVDDSPGWRGLSGTGPLDRSWPDYFLDLTDALDAWRKNFMIRRIVTLARAYVVAGGIVIDSEHRDVDRFCRQFWGHEQNEMDTRIGPICDELTRAGEVFVVLHTNKADGMSYVRCVPATEIEEVITAPNDYELELAYRQAGLDGRVWKSPNNPNLRPSEPIMMHFCVNRPVGCTRGESDLTPILKWALRYSNWLEDRVRLNRLRTRQGMLDIKITDDTQVEVKRQTLLNHDPMESGIYVHGSGEDVTFHELRIQADQVADDGRALRFAIACGANTALHYMGEGDTTNYASAKEMGEPTARFYSERQDQLCKMLMRLVRVAFVRYTEVTGEHLPDDLKLKATTHEVARADNANLALAAMQIVTALSTMKQQGWIDDATAIKLAFKFAGESLSEEDIKKILAASTPKPATTHTPGTSQGPAPAPTVNPTDAPAEPAQ